MVATADKSKELCLLSGAVLLVLTVTRRTPVGAYHIVGKSQACALYVAAMRHFCHWLFSFRLSSGDGLQQSLSSLKI